MYAAVMNWEFDVARTNPADAELLHVAPAGADAPRAPVLRNSIIPMVKQSPGFVSGTWLRTTDLTRAVSVLIYESEETAQAAADRAAQGLPPRSRLISADVLEVLEQA